MKFMKHITAFLFVFSILAVIPIVIYQACAIESGFNVNGYYRNALFSTTIAAISNQHTKCNYAKLNNNTAVFNKIECTVGTVKLY